MGLEKVFKLEPEVIHKEAYDIVGVEKLFIDGKTEEGDGVPVVYQELVERLQKGEIPNVVDSAVHIGVQWHGPTTKVNYPSVNWQGEEEPDFYHLAGVLVTAFGELAEGLTARTIPTSEYVIFSCEVEKDPGTGEYLGEVDWDDVEKLFDAYLKFQRNKRKLGYREKEWYLEVSHHYDKGFWKYELMVAVEKRV